MSSVPRRPANRHQYATEAAEGLDVGVRAIGAASGMKCVGCSGQCDQGALGQHVVASSPMGSQAEAVG